MAIWFSAFLGGFSVCVEVEGEDGGEGLECALLSHCRLLGCERSVQGK